MKSKLDHKKLAVKWQKRWKEKSLYTPSIETAARPFYNLWMFPYPSAEGLHAGHAFAGTGSDAFGRYMRMNGRDVFQPIGYDSFGIHSENYAIKIGETPEKMLERTTAHYEDQLRSLGHGYDWTRTVTTSSPDYYKWTQWIFTVAFKAGLAYRKEARVNWCPSCKTVLSDEQVIDSKCERCGTVVEHKNLTQWFMGITKYADRLLENLDKIDWTPSVKQSQRNWIGRKEGINITYTIKGTAQTVVCFTTRPDTNFGATFVVVSPEYAQLNLLPIMDDQAKQASEAYIKTSLGKTEQQRAEEGTKKTGVFTGLFAVNNVNGEEMPIWISDFVLSGFGTGAVVGVPGHDKRDFQFAQEFGIPVKRVVEGINGDTSDITDIEQVQEEHGVMLNSDFLNGMNIHDATVAMMDFMEAEGYGQRVTSYHLRDWLVSRQRYWGAPIPMIYCERCAREGNAEVPSAEWNSAGWYSVPDTDLPVLLPHLDDYKPKGEGKGPLADHPEFYETTCPSCGAPAVRETDVFDTFMDSSWYFLRYPSVGLKNDQTVAFDPEVTKKWLPVNLYFGGAEHSVLHLLYARFVTQVLFDQKKISFEEPFPKFYAHGLMIKDGAKMSKSRGNVVNPDTYIEKFGADTMRLYLMFMGPMDGSPDFRDTGIEGMERFTNRVWDLLNSYGTRGVSPEDRQALIAKMHKTIKKVTSDMDVFHYNTAIASIMEYVNFLKDVSLGDDTESWNHALISLAQLLAPFAPHVTEEVWCEVFKKEGSIHVSSWPQYDEAQTVEATVIIPVQVNGKLRGQLTVSAEDSQNKEIIVEKARADEKVKSWIISEPTTIIFVPGRLLNFVL